MQMDSFTREDNLNIDFRLWSRQRERYGLLIFCGCHHTTRPATTTCITWLPARPDDKHMYSLDVGKQTLFFSGEIIKWISICCHPIVYTGLLVGSPTQGRDAPLELDLQRTEPTHVLPQSCATNYSWIPTANAHAWINFWTTSYTIRSWILTWVN